jgi:hypothetical protein
VNVQPCAGFRYNGFSRVEQQLYHGKIWFGYISKSHDDPLTVFLAKLCREAILKARGRFVTVSNLSVTAEMQTSPRRRGRMISSRRFSDLVVEAFLKSDKCPVSTIREPFTWISSIAP